MTAPSSWASENRLGIAWGRRMTALNVAAWRVRRFRRLGCDFWPRAGIVLLPQRGLDCGRLLSIPRLGAQIEGYRSRSGFLAALSTGPAQRVPNARRQDLRC